MAEQVQASANRIYVRPNHPLLSNSREIHLPHIRVAELSDVTVEELRIVCQCVPVKCSPKVIQCINFASTVLCQRCYITCTAVYNASQFLICLWRFLHLMSFHVSHITSCHFRFTMIYKRYIICHYSKSRWITFQIFASLYGISCQPLPFFIYH